MLSCITNWRTLALSLAVGGVVTAAPLFAADPPAGTVEGRNTKVCSTCHKVEASTFRGYFETVAMKSSSLQVKVDDKSEVLKFDKATIKVSNPDVKDGDIEKQLRGIKKNHEVKVVVELKNGVQYAKAIVAKPPIKVDEAKLIKVDEVEKLVAMGPEKGNFTLIDSRPLPRYQDGFIPGAINLPYPAFDKNLDKLPADKNRLIIFYCAGITCTMSPKSLEKAEQLGYKNVKVYREGMPGWLQRKPGVMTVKFIKEAWLDKEMPFVLLDTRAQKDAEQAFIKGAVSFPVADEKTLKLLPKKDVKAPIFVYDADGKGNAQSVAQGIVKAGFAPVLVVDGGIAAWQKAGLPLVKGALAAKAAYTPKPKAGEISIDNFKKLIAAIPADTILIDVRLPDEVKEGAIAGAVNIPAAEVDQNLARLPKEKRIVAYCNSGTQAEMAYHTLKGKGYSNVFFLNAKVEVDEGKVEITR
jgi:rhodanese-related sulfurtransferase